MQTWRLLKTMVPLLFCFKNSRYIQNYKFLSKHQEDISQIVTNWNINPGGGFRYRTVTFAKKNLRIIFAKAASGKPPAKELIKASHRPGEKMLHYVAFTLVIFQSRLVK